MTSDSLCGNYGRSRHVVALGLLLVCCSCQWTGLAGTLGSLSVLSDSVSSAEPETNGASSETVQTVNCPTCEPRTYTLDSFPSLDQATGAPLSGDAACRICASANQAEAALYSDEYLCDGGDQATLAQINRRGDISGLDTEDTVTAFDTLAGDSIVTPSNSVCIYAPRFAAVRQIVHTSEDGLALTMHALNAPLPTIADDSTEHVVDADHTLPVQRRHVVRGPIALRHRTRGVEMANSLPVHELVEDFATYEDFQVIRTGIERRSQRTAVEASADAAVVWTDNIAAEVILDSEPAEIDVTVNKVGTEYQIGPEGHPRVRLIKLASTDAAIPGEEVTFTLRFDNTGDQTVAHVTLLDHLTTRLEYVPDSAECSVKAQFFADTNSSQSLTLRWDLGEPIRPGEGGVIRFRCKVR